MLTRQKPSHFNARMVAAAVLLLAVAIAAYFVLPDPVDWTIFYRPAALALASGSSPYAVGSFFNPPWILLPLVPFAWLPYRMGVAALCVANLLVFLYIGRRLKAGPLALLALFCSLPVIVCMLFGQIDGLVLLGLFMPRPLGMIFLLAKPQVGGVVAFFWLVEAWRAGGWKQAGRLLVPVGALFLLSLLIYGLWPLNFNFDRLAATQHNTSLWPGSLMVGLPLLVYALRWRSQDFVLLSAPFLSPYLAPQSWSIALLGLVPYPLELAAASLASWALFLTRLTGP